MNIRCLLTAVLVTAAPGAYAGAHTGGTDVVSGASVAPAEAGRTISFASAGMQLELREVTRTGNVIWALDFIAPDALIFTERNGAVKLLNLDTAAITEVSGGPEVLVTTSGGLFDVLVDPEFAQNGFIYFTYVKPVGGGQSAIALARARLDGAALTDLTDLFVANNPSDDHAHWGSRVVMDADRYLYMTVGDRHVPNNAQNLASHGGKVLRFQADGSVPADNPFAGQADAVPEIWSLGHRNPQGLVIHPGTGELYEQEHGPTGGDEINLIRKGLNYGWPLITWGENIWGGQSYEGRSRIGLEQPFYYWLPGIAPSGIAFYNGEPLSGWRGNAFNATLRGHLNRLVLVDGRVYTEERLLINWRERMRDVEQGPDGFLYIATESGAIAVIRPAGS